MGEGQSSPAVLSPQQELDQVLQQEQQCLILGKGADPFLLVERGSCLSRLARYSEALEAFAEAEIQLRERALPDFPELHKRRGVVLYQLSRFEEAMASYDRAERLQREQDMPEDWELAKNRGNIYFRLDNDAKALELYEEAERIRERQGLPVYPYLSMNRGIALIGLARYDEALAAFDESEHLQQAQGLPPKPDLVMNRGLAYQHLGRNEEALQNYDEAQRLRQMQGLPEDPNLCLNRAIALGRLGRTGEALIEYSRSESLSRERGEPEEPRVYFYRALDLYAADQKSTAIEQACQSILAYGKLKLEIPPFVMETVKEWLATPAVSAVSALQQSTQPGAVEPTPAEEKVYDAFICYRRAASLGHAMLIKTHLDLNGQSVFRDQDSLEKGRFRDHIESAVRKSHHLIVLMTPGFFDKCISNEQDDVRREIRTALLCGTQIIPVMMEDFHWPSPEQLPEDIRDICSINGMSFSSEFFGAFMDKLLRWMS